MPDEQEDQQEQSPERPLDAERPEPVDRRSIPPLTEEEMAVPEPEPIFGRLRREGMTSGAGGAESGRLGEDQYVGFVGDDADGSRIVGEGGETGVWAMVEGYSPLGEAQWLYVLQRAAKGTSGYGGWQKYDAGQAAFAGYNTVENYNYAAGAGSPDTPYGNGATYGKLNNDDPEEGYAFKVQPCPKGVIVWVRAVYVDDSEEPEYWFEYVNGVDGTCTEDTVPGDEPGVS